MKRTIRITEAQLLNLADKKRNLIESEVPLTYKEHWERKFEKSAEILLKLGHTPDELLKKIEEIASSPNKTNEQEMSPMYGEETQASLDELDRESFRHEESLQALRDALNKNVIVGVAFVKKDGTVRHMSIKRTLGSYVGSATEKTTAQANVNENNNIKKIIDVNAYIKALKANGGNKEQAASAAWRTLYFQNVLGFVVGVNFFDLREENEIMERYGEQVYNSLTKSMVKAMEQQNHQDNAELENNE